MDHFIYQDGTLRAEDVSVAEIAATVGTPFYLYSTATLVRHFRLFDEALSWGPHLVCYAMKAASNQAILKTLAHEGAGMDVVSGGEYARAKAAGYSNSYFSLATVPLTLKKNADKFTDWADLDKASVTVAATLGTTQEKQVKQFFPNAKYKIVEAPARDFQEVLAGRADAHITSNVEAYKLVAKYPEMMVVPVSAPKAPTPIAMLLPQADQVWINYVNTWIALKTERGFFADLGRKWQLAN